MARQGGGWLDTQALRYEVGLGPGMRCATDRGATNRAADTAGRYDEIDPNPPGHRWIDVRSNFKRFCGLLIRFVIEAEFDRGIATRRALRFAHVVAISIYARFVVVAATMVLHHHIHHLADVKRLRLRVPDNQQEGQQEGPDKSSSRSQHRGFSISWLTLIKPHWVSGGA